MVKQHCNIRTFQDIPDSFAPEDFVNPPPHDHHCVVCGCIPRKPWRSECCRDKLYCDPCSRNVRQCNEHQQEMKFIIEKEKNKHILKRKVRCPNSEKGCDQKTTPKKMYKEHLPQCTFNDGGICSYINLCSYMHLLIAGR